MVLDIHAVCVFLPLQGVLLAKDLDCLYSSISISCVFFTPYISVFLTTHTHTHSPLFETVAQFENVSAHKTHCVLSSSTFSTHTHTHFSFLTRTVSDRLFWVDASQVLRFLLPAQNNKGDWNFICAVHSLEFQKHLSLFFFLRK